MHTTSDFTYNGEIYNIAQDFIAPKKCLSFVSNHVKGNRRINKKLYDYANLGKECVILGVGNHIEIWDEQEYDKYLNENPDIMATISEELVI